MRRRASLRMPSLADKSADSGEDSELEYQGKNKSGWTRELRSTFVLSSRKRNLRVKDKDVRPARSIRACRIQVLSRSRANRYSYHDDDEEDEEDDDDDGMFDSPKRRHKNYLQDASSSKQEDGIRRSTRQRKLKFDNYNDSWIVGGTHSLRGYPSLNPSFSKMKVVKEEDNSEEEKEEDDDEEEEEEDGKQAKPSRSMRSSRLEEARLRSEESECRGTSKENGETSRTSAPERRTRQSKTSLENSAGGSGAKSGGEVGNDGGGRAERTGGANSSAPSGTGGAITENGFEDMYARVKQRRRIQAKSESSSGDRSSSGGEGEEEEEEEEGEGGGGERRSTQLRRRPSRSARDTARVESRQYSLRQKKPTGQRFQEGVAGSSSDSTSSSAMEERRSKRLRRNSLPTPNRRIQRKYSLRQKKPTVQRFQAEPLGPRSVLREVITLGRRKRRRRDTSSSSSSSTDSHYDRKKKSESDRGRRNRRELLGGNNKSTGLLADVDPVTLDTSITFANIGGLERHVTALKEMVVFPILYPEVFEKFGVTPPKGVLFHGPPGTGKTLMARALANECSIGAKKVSFFMRKGADVLSKWVGESERQLRILFEEAQSARPSIIFFDELDGLAPVRSTKQDQIHASIVCTLLALMDGLDNRGDIIIIGATNRIDSIDPALRRPGRFDRELHFPLPGVKERREILEVHAGKWAEQEVLNRLAETSVGYCGSDLRALCTEAVIQSLRRVYPQIYTTSQKLLINHERVKVTRIDFERAARGIVPAAHRALPSLGRKLPQYLEPLLGGPLASILELASEVFPAALNKATPPTSGAAAALAGVGELRIVRSPRILIAGLGPEPALLAGSLMYKLEHCPMISLSLDYLYADSSRSVEESITRVFKELPQNRGSVLWFGDIGVWWGSLSRAARSVFLTLLSTLDPYLPVLFLGTSSSEITQPELQSLFSESRGEVFTIPRPSNEQKEAFFRPLFRIRALKPPPPPKKTKDIEKLEVAPPPPPPKLSEEQLKQVFDEEENTLRELRIFLRQICAKLARNKQFYMFSKPVDVAEVPDYLQIIQEPMDLETMMTKIDLHKYACAQDFLTDVDLLCKNALEYNPDRDPADKLIRHRACYLRDTAYALIKAEMDSDFEISCRSIREARAARAENSTQRFVEEFFKDDNPAEEGSCPAPGACAGGGSLGLAAPGAGGNGNSSNCANTTGDASLSAATHHDSSGKRKVRRVKSWQKGIVKRPSKRLKPSPDSSREEDGSKFLNKMDEEGSIDKKSSTSPDGGRTPCRPDETEASETEGHLTEKEDEKRLEVDREKLSSLLKSAARLTENIPSIEPLIDLYLALRAVIDSYRPSWNRSAMTKDLEKELKKFASERMDTNSASTPSS